MCGIIAIIQKNGKPAVKKLRKAYQQQKSRGSEGFGFIAIQNGTLQHFTRKRFEKEIFKELSPIRATDLLFHHRQPTSTQNTENTAHPIPVSHPSLEYDYYVVHNGVITNDKELSLKFKEEGFTYTTELVPCVYSKYEDMYYVEDDGKTQHNDSETLAIDLALAIEHGADKIQSKGGIVFMALQVNKKTQKCVSLFFGKNDGRPLVLEDTATYVRISSIGSGKPIEEHKLHCYDYATKKFSTIRDFSIGEKHVSYASKWPKTDVSKKTTEDYKPAPFLGKDNLWWIWNTAKHQLDRCEEPKSEMGFTTDTGTRPQIASPRTAHSHAENRVYNAYPDSEEDMRNGYMEYETLKEREDEERRARNTVALGALYTLIPGYEESILEIKTSEGMKTFIFKEDVYDAYDDVTAKIEDYADILKYAQKKNDTHGIAEASVLYNAYVSDEKEYKKYIDAIWPEPISVQVA